MNKKNAKEKKTMFKEEEKQLKAKMKQLEAEKRYDCFIVFLTISYFVSHVN